MSFVVRHTTLNTYLCHDWAFRSSTADVCDAEQFATIEDANEVIEELNNDWRNHAVIEPKPGASGEG